jgi:hypothetical protein
MSTQFRRPVAAGLLFYIDIDTVFLESLHCSIPVRTLLDPNSGTVEVQQRRCSVQQCNCSAQQRRSQGNTPPHRPTGFNFKASSTPVPISCRRLNKLTGHTLMWWMFAPWTRKFSLSRKTIYLQMG